MEDEKWVPRTELGKLVASGQIKSMSEALATKLPLREYQIVDILMPDIKDEIIYIERAQRMTDSGRRMNYSISAVEMRMALWVLAGERQRKPHLP